MKFLAIHTACKHRGMELTAVDYDSGSRQQPPLQGAGDQFRRILLHEMIGVRCGDDGGIAVIPVPGIVKTIRMQGRVL